MSAGSQSQSQSGSHALLLRLFQSQSYFSVHLALQYLFTYYDHIGITHYITGRLRELDDSELDDVWGFICHLLVTRPSKSCALETFVVERAEQSTHSALLTLWFMQTYLTDLSTTRRNTPSFTICQRVLLKAQNIIFSDPPTQSNTPYGKSPRSPPTTRFWKRRVKPRIGPALIGMSAILAGSPGLPQLTAITGRVAVEQGRVASEDSAPRPFQVHDDDDEPVGMSASTSSLPPRSVNGNDAANDSDELEEDETVDDSDEEQDVDTFGQSTMPKLHIPADQQATAVQRHSPAEQQPGASGLARRTTIGPGPSRTTPSLIRPTRFGSRVNQRAPSPSASTPSLHRTASLSAGNVLQQEDSLSRLDPSIQTQLLKGHYCRSEIQFVLTLESISNRLLVVPKLARVSALRAELTALNHKLPAEVDIPMWTTDADSSSTAPREKVKGHSRIVRIPPGESVVLNSAERAPYLLMVEVLVGDLDFTPTKRSNKEILRRMIAKDDAEDVRRRSLADAGVGRRSGRSQSSGTNVISIHTGVSFSDRTPPMPELGVDDDAGPSVPMSATSSMAMSEPPEEYEEEVDLVEQLYGADVSVRSQAGDLSDSIVLPAAPKNKALDVAAWSKGSPSLSRQNSATNSPILTPLQGPHSVDGRSIPPSPLATNDLNEIPPRHQAPLSLEDYSERMRTAAIMLAQLNANLIREPVTTITAPTIPSAATGAGGAVPLPIPSSSTALAPTSSSSGTEPSSPSLSWLPGTSWIKSSSSKSPRNPSDSATAPPPPPTMRMKLQYAEATAIRDKIMTEMMALEEERMERMKEPVDAPSGTVSISDSRKSAQAVEDESIVRRELNKLDPSAAVVRESWLTKKSRIRSASPYGHLANWDCLSVIVKTGADLRQEQMAVQLIQIFDQIWKAEKCGCWVKHFRILITGSTSGLIETITDAVSVHSIKKAEYARRIAEGRFANVTLMDHFVATYGDPSSAKFARAQRCFAKSLAGYSLITYLLQIKDRHNGNILINREGHIIHIDFGFMLSNSPGNVGLEASPFKFPLEYVEVLGGLESEAYQDFKRLFREGFEAARKHCDSIVALVELMQKDSMLPCFAAFGEQTAPMLRDRFQQALPHSAIGEHVDRLIMSSMGSNWTRLYDSFQYYSQSIL